MEMEMEMEMGMKMEVEVELDVLIQTAFRYSFCILHGSEFLH